MVKVNIEGVREAWLRNMPAEAKLWLAHIDRRTQEVLDLYEARRMPLFEIGDLLYNVCSYLNWLAHIELREERYVKEPEMITFLQRATDWPPEACEAFWFCVRNPVMHTGRTSVFADYDRKTSDGIKAAADLHPNLTFDPAQFQPDQFKPTVEQDGFIALLDPEKVNHGSYWFYFPGIRRKLDNALRVVVAGIEGADPRSVLGLYKINNKTIAFRVSGIGE